MATLTAFDLDQPTILLRIFKNTVKPLQKTYWKVDFISGTIPYNHFFLPLRCEQQTFTCSGWNVNESCTIPVCLSVHSLMVHFGHRHKNEPFSKHVTTGGPFQHNCIYI